MRWMLPSHLAKSGFSLPYQFCFCPHNSPHAPQRHNAIIIISPLLLSTPTTGTFGWIVTQYFHLCMFMSTLKDTNADCEWPALELSFLVYHIIFQSLQFSAVSIFWPYSNILCVKSILISYLHTWFIQLFTWGKFSSFIKRHNNTQLIHLMLQTEINYTNQHFFLQRGYIE